MMTAKIYKFDIESEAAEILAADRQAEASARDAIYMLYDQIESGESLSDAIEVVRQQNETGLNELSDRITFSAWDVTFAPDFDMDEEPF